MAACPTLSEIFFFSLSLLMTFYDTNYEAGKIGEKMTSTRTAQHIVQLACESNQSNCSGSVSRVLFACLTSSSFRFALSIHGKMCDHLYLNTFSLKHNQCLWGQTVKQPCHLTEMLTKAFTLR